MIIYKLRVTTCELQVVSCELSVSAFAEMFPAWGKLLEQGTVEAQWISFCKKNALMSKDNIFLLTEFLCAQ